MNICSKGSPLGFDILNDNPRIYPPIECVVVQHMSTICVYHQYTLKIPNRDNIHKMLLENGVGAMLYYPVPLHLQKVHAHLGFTKGMLPVTEKNTELVFCSSNVNSGNIGREITSSVFFSVCGSIPFVNPK